MDSSVQAHEAPPVADLARYGAPRRGLNPRAMNRVVIHIEENLGESLTLSTLAAVACVSRFHFARMFRLSTGYSPMAYVLRRRVERARLQLAQGYQRLSELAAELGFCDQSHFTRIFRRMTGFTPREYARRHEPPHSGFERDGYSYTRSAVARAASDWPAP
jgi:AraC family transcriptional regulator